MYCIELTMLPYSEVKVALEELDVREVEVQGVGLALAQCKRIL